MHQSQSKKIALSGVFAALALTCMLLGGIFPLATFLAPAIAGVLIVPVAVEFGLKNGVVVYASIGLLALFIVPDKELAFIFVFFLGYYPLAKAKLDKIASKVVQLSTKFALFNISIVGMYGLLLFLFPIDALVQEFNGMGLSFIGVLWIMGNVTFWIYDMALARIIGLYLIRFRPKLMRMH